MATPPGNMHRKLVKFGRVRRVIAARPMRADRQTDRQLHSRPTNRQTRLSKYFTVRTRPGHGVEVMLRIV